MTYAQYSPEKTDPQLIAMKTLGTGQITYLEQLYLDSFPAEERRPWSEIIRPEQNYGPRLYGVEWQGKICGLITLWTLSLSDASANMGRYHTAVYIEHFAIDPSRRGGGVGSKVLSAVKKLENQPIVFEIERDGEPDGMEVRRRRFYERNGFVCLDYNYIQPSYAPGLPEVPLTLMSDKADIDPAAVDAALRKFVYKAV